jgi:transposase
MKGLYGEEVRKIAIRQLIDEKKTLEVVSKNLGITTRTLTNWKRIYKTEGRSAPILQKNRNQSNKSKLKFRMIKDDSDFKKFVEQNGGLAKEQMAQQYEKIINSKVTKKSVSNALKRIGFSFKKKL